MCSSSHLKMPEDELFGDVGKLIDDARWRVARTVDRQLVMLHWGIGERIREYVLPEKRAEYRERILAELAKTLTARYGRAYSRRRLSEMISVAEVWPDGEIVRALSARLAWSHFTRLVAIEDRLERDFYTLMASRERWSARTLREQIDGRLYKRTIATTKPVNSLEAELVALRASGLTTPDLTLRDPYVLDFLRVSGQHTDGGLEEAAPSEPLA